MKGKELKKLMDERTETITMTHSEILLLHGMATLSDGRGWLAKIIRRRIRPVALKILKEQKEYH